MNAPARQFPQREKHALDDFKLRLSAEKLPNGKSRPTLTVTVVNNNPRFVVYTQVEGDKDNGKIQAEVDMQVMYSILEAIEMVIAGPNDNRFQFVNKNFTWFGGKKSDTPQVLSKIQIGKDNTGVVYISVLSAQNDRPKIKFPFGFSNFHQLVRPGTDEAVPESEISVLAAKGWIRLMTELLADVFVDKWTEPQKKEGGGGGGNRGGYGGGGGNRGGGGNSYGASSGGDFDDDLPM